MQSKKVIFLILSILMISSLVLTGCFAQKAEAQTTAPALSALMPQTEPAETAAPNTPVASGPPIVYFTTDISPAGLLAVYEALGLKATGRVAVKIHTGEPGNRNFIRPALMKDLVQKVNGTFVETNVAYASRRASTARHYQVARDHGFNDVAPVVILDARTPDLSFPITGGTRLTETLVGSRFNEFDFHIVISNFTGHGISGFGGAIKNLSIGYASAAGKAWIHSSGSTRTVPMTRWNWPVVAFKESMAEGAQGIMNQVNGRILFINVLSNLSVDCDCHSGAGLPTMAAIGILASLDPVALDQASVDLVFAAQDGRDLAQRIRSRNGLLTLEHAERLGVGTRAYQLVKLQ
ncbi:MAG: DUF362 domain-containing protein [Spirochaetes bacterium]|nr:DUF362 domain-containing protein [Spirochaetota bacterium]